MNTAYCSVEDCVDIIPSLADLQEESARLEAVLFQSILDASRLIESDLSLPVDYFAKASDTVFTAKTIYNDGTQFIRLPPYTEIESIKDINDEEVDTESYRLSDIQLYDPRSYFLKWLFKNCATSWWSVSKIIVNARWGFPCIPPDIVMAVKSMACLMFLNDPQARAGLESALEDGQALRLRTSYNKVNNSWLDKLHHRQLGIG